eukprot:scaffold225677_cov23-Prasinocladus_malaysianus.AAC.1
MQPCVCHSNALNLFGDVIGGDVCCNADPLTFETLFLPGRPPSLHGTASGGSGSGKKKQQRKEPSAVDTTSAKKKAFMDSGGEMLDETVRLSKR